ncbi:hypothetical protein [Salinarimonas rosea]|uniref:hypothetical protein n=1 Tax=Salinarimonas rosea TaxID=552063 RepID=UPI0004253417|nr:hypothetical protein [Salinarimonas rosea]
MPWKDPPPNVTLSHDRAEMARLMGSVTALRFMLALFLSASFSRPGGLTALADLEGQLAAQPIAHPSGSDPIMRSAIDDATRAEIRRICADARARISAADDAAGRRPN